MSEGGSVYHYERDSEGNTLRKSAWGGRTLYEATYDACGRITMLDGTRYQYDKVGPLQQAESEQGIRAAYRYNKNGMQREVVCGNGLRTTYGYDSRNQLISLNAGFDGKESLLQASYRYDGNGNKTGKEEQLQRNHGAERVLEQTTYCYDKMNRLTRESRNGNEASYQYDAFGETVIQEENQSRLKYNSQIWDELSGLYYLRARYYNPRTGRFTQEDVVYNDGLNLYAYCDSNPLIYKPESTKHSNYRGDVTKRPTGSVVNDIQKARAKDILIESNGNIIIRGANGRVHVLSPDGQRHITTLKRTSSNVESLIKKGRYRQASYSEIDKILNQYRN